MLLTVIIQSAIQIDDGGGDREVLSLLTAKMPAFIATLDSDAAPTSMEGCRRLGALLQLLRTMLKSSISKEVSSVFLQHYKLNILMILSFIFLVSLEQCFSLFCITVFL